MAPGPIDADGPIDAASSARARLFIAVVPPPDVIDALAAARAAFEAAHVPRLRWVRPDKIHLTLKFLGDTPLRLQARVEEAMEETAVATAPHLLQLCGFGIFTERRPRVLWAGLGGAVEEVRACAGRLDQALLGHGLPLDRREGDRRPLAAHLTLARLPERASAQDREALRAAVERVAGPPPLPYPVTALRLIRSYLEPGGEPL